MNANYLRAALMPYARGAACSLLQRPGPDAAAEARQKRRARLRRRSEQGSRRAQPRGERRGLDAATDITVDTQYLNRMVTERYLEYFSRKAGEAKAFDKDSSIPRPRDR
jgi:hypothetical protein